MAYGRLGQSEPNNQTNHSDTAATSRTPKPNRNKLIFLYIIAAGLILVSGIFGIVLVTTRMHQSTGQSTSQFLNRKPTQAISRACKKTRFPSLCIDSLLDFPGSSSATEKDLVHITFNMTLQHFGKALYSSSTISSFQMDPHVRSAFDDCLELLDDSLDSLSRSLSYVSGGSPANKEDVMTWLSSALTNHDTCQEGFSDINGGEVKNQMVGSLQNLSEMVSNCLAIFAASGSDDFAGIPIENKRRLMEADVSGGSDGTFPKWLSRKDRKLLDIPPSDINADIIVSKDGNGTVDTIAAAIKKAPEHSTRRTIIWVKSGRYEEKNLKVGRKKINLMFIGDGKGKTVISGGMSIFDNVTTFHTASFAATGAGFIAKGITFENWAGPAKHQAVALRIGADHAVVYQCNIIGYQDTLYVHSNRQFFRECDIYGTVDFIFGNAAVVLQNCSIYARKPMDLQKNTITAQNRKDPFQNSGISIHACRILPTSDLKMSNTSFQTFLGRPWKLYSRTVYMLSYIDSHIAPRGWLEWNATFALDTLYYGEYMNYGPGAAIGQRVTWPGYRVITSAVEAARFTVSEFIYGASWLPSTGVAYLAGLSV